jgi:hypothetical protein
LGDRQAGNAKNHFAKLTLSNRSQESLQEKKTMANTKKIAIRGSEHAALPGARAIGPIDPHQIIEVSLILKHRQELPKLTGSEKRMTHSDYARTYGADPAHVDKIRQFAKENNLQMLERGDEVLRRTLTLAGTAAAMEKAFSVDLNEFDHPDGSYRGHTGAIQMPEDLAAIVTGVFGLDTRPVVHPHIRFRTANRAFGSRLGTVSYNPQNVARLYNFPTGATGAGQTIGILEFGGGYRPADITDYFQNLGLTAPTVKAVSVDQAQNRPSTPQSADGEVLLDIEVAGAVVPGVAIAVYFANNSARGFQDALSTAIHDQLRQPSVISISWGGAESTWSSQSMVNFDQVAQEAALLGITVTVASGDSGSSDGVNDGQACGLPGLMPPRACSRRNAAHGRKQHHPKRTSLERWRARRRHRRRLQHSVHAAGLARRGRDHSQSWGSRPGGRRRSRHRLQHSRRRAANGCRRHQRGRSFDGGPHRPSESKPQPASRFREPGVLWRRAPELFPGYYRRQQRRLLG